MNEDWRKTVKMIANSHTNERYGKLADRMTLRQKLLLNSLYGKRLNGPHKHAYALVGVDHYQAMDDIKAWNDYFRWYKFTCTKCGKTVQIQRGVFWSVR